jgi:hypothetical protein
MHRRAGLKQCLTIFLNGVDFIINFENVKFSKFNDNSYTSKDIFT